MAAAAAEGVDEDEQVRRALAGDDEDEEAEEEAEEEAAETTDTGNAADQPVDVDADPAQKKKKGRKPPCVANNPVRQRELMEFLTCADETEFHGYGIGDEAVTTWGAFRKQAPGGGGAAWYYSIYKHWVHMDPSIKAKDDHPDVVKKGLRAAVAVNMAGKISEIKKKWEKASYEVSGTPRSDDSIKAEAWLRSRNLYDLCQQKWPNGKAGKRKAKGAPRSQQARAPHVDTGEAEEGFQSSRATGNGFKKARSTPSPSGEEGGGLGSGGSTGRKTPSDPGSDGKPKPTTGLQPIMCKRWWAWRAI